MPVQAGKYYVVYGPSDDPPMEVKVCVPIEDGIKSKDCDVVIGKKRLKVGIRGQEPVIDDELWKPSNFEESFWEIDRDEGQRCIVVTIKKVGKWDRWLHLVKCEEVLPDTTCTVRAFLDVTADGEPMGRVVLGLYGNEVPKTVENFRALCTGEKGLTGDGKPLHYRGSPFHRVIPGFMCQAGDFTNLDGTGGESIYGEKFADEGYRIKHSKAGILSMSNVEGMNGSQFFITLKERPTLDGRHVVFGEVLEGYADVVLRLEKLGSTPSGATSKEILIADCGVL